MKTLKKNTRSNARFLAEIRKMYQADNTLWPLSTLFTSMLQRPVNIMNSLAWFVSHLRNIPVIHSRQCSSLKAQTFACRMFLLVVVFPSSDIFKNQLFKKKIDQEYHQSVKLSTVWKVYQQGMTTLAGKKFSSFYDNNNFIRITPPVGL